MSPAYRAHAQKSGADNRKLGGSFAKSDINTIESWHDHSEFRSSYRQYKLEVEDDGKRALKQPAVV